MKSVSDLTLTDGHNGVVVSSLQSLGPYHDVSEGISRRFGPKQISYKGTDKLDLETTLPFRKRKYRSKLNRQKTVDNLSIPSFY